MWTFAFGVAALFALALLGACWIAACWQQQDLPSFAAFAILFVGAAIYFASRAFW